MPLLALAMLALYFALAFGLRTWIQWHRTGSTGFRGVSGRVGSAEWAAGALLVMALGAAVFAPVAQLLGLARPLQALETPIVVVTGLLLAAGGMAGTLWAQLAMGDSWRIGVDPRERTALVDAGAFRHVRNPIFTSMLAGMGGLALLTPNVVAAVALVTLVVALELQVRRVEEPYLVRAHGDAYRRYAASTGRFLPGIGRLAGPTPPHS